jgi:hypothetical protein
VSFISNAFGAQNNFTPGGGNAQQQQYVTGANANYQQANTGLNSLAQMLQQQAQGGGPNLANQNLQNFTGQNVANQASLMAGQRGASANPALIARQAAMQGAGIQQQAAGQAASNVLAQQLAAQQQLGGVYGTQGSLANQNYATTQGGVNTNNQIQSGQAAQNAATNGQIAGSIFQAAGAGLGAMGASGGGMPKPITTLAPGVGTTQSAGGYDSTPMNTTNMFKAAEGGEIQKEGVLRAKFPKPKTKIPDHLQHIANIRYPHLAHGGEVPIMVSPGERILDPKAANDVAHGKADPIKASTPVPGHAKYKGDNYANDTVPKNAQAGSIVIPKSVTEKKSPKLAYDFVSRVKAGHHRPKGKK